MRWFFTRPTALADKLAEVGETIVSTSDMHVDALMTKYGVALHEIDSAIYGGKLWTHLKQTPCDVLVLVDPLVGDLFGYPREVATKKTRSINRKMVIAGLSNNDPALYQRYQSKTHRHCLCRLQDCSVWISNDLETAVAVARGRRAAWLEEPLGVRTAVLHAQSATYKGTEGPFRG